MFHGRTVIITGASRGIGKAIGLALAKQGANIVVAAKTDLPHSKLPGTIHTAAAEMERAGGCALACVVDVRDEKSIRECIRKTLDKFGSIDMLINNASAIALTDTETTEMKRYDLMQAINTRGTYLMSKLCRPHLKLSANPHILNISPPLSMEARFFAPHVAYTIAKYGMSLCVLGMAEEFREDHVAVNALWPLTMIWTSAAGGDSGEMCRKSDIMADAALAILSKNSSSFTGNFVIDEDFLRKEGVKDFSKYDVVPGGALAPDLFINHEDYEIFKSKL